MYTNTLTTQPKMDHSSLIKVMVLADRMGRNVAKHSVEGYNDELALKYFKISRDVANLIIRYESNLHTKSVEDTTNEA